MSIYKLSKKKKSDTKTHTSELVVEAKKYNKNGKKHLTKSIFFLTSLTAETEKPLHLHSSHTFLSIHINK